MSATVYMPSRLNMNQIRYFPWKGKTFYQVVESFQKNRPTYSRNKPIAPNTVMHALPLKIYRREIASKRAHSNMRTSSSIDRINAPGGTITRQSLYDPSCNLVNTLDSKQDMHIPKNTGEIPGQCSPCFLNPAENARRRVRSAGMMRNKYDPVKNSNTYSTGTNQYLVSRNLTYQQNQYNFIQQGDPTAKPGTSQSKSNVYSANGQTHCPRIHITAALNNHQFSYYWIQTGSTLYTVTIPDGYYNVSDFNAMFKLAMYKNGHYYVSKSSLTAVYMLNIMYDNNTNKVVIQAANAKPIYANSGNYTNSNGTPISGPEPKQYAQFVIPSTPIQSVLGFAAATYPSSPTTATTDAYQLSANQSGSLKPTFVAVVYKPNNPQFAQQGAVSAGAHLVRVKYNTINTVAATYTKAYGANTANALAYGVSERAYTIKDKIGYPNSCTKNTGICKNFRYRPLTLGF
jgi:hypothetical protein